jgi:hypothetical protein
MVSRSAGPSEGVVVCHLPHAGSATRHPAYDPTHVPRVARVAESGMSGAKPSSSRRWNSSINRTRPVASAKPVTRRTTRPPQRILTHRGIQHFILLRSPVCPERNRRHREAGIARSIERGQLCQPSRFRGGHHGQPNENITKRVNKPYSCWGVPCVQIGTVLIPKHEKIEQSKASQSV